MDETEASRYWCHMCSQTVSPIMEVESVKCPICLGGFVEEMESAAAAANVATTNDGDLIGVGASDPDRSASLWAPILLGVLSNPRRLRRLSLGFEQDDEDDVSNENNNESLHNHYHHHHHQQQQQQHGLGMNSDQEHDDEFSITRRRANNVLRLLHAIRAGLQSSIENSEDDQRGERERGTRDGGRVILINPFNQTIVIQGSIDSNGNSQNVPIGSLGDYFAGPGLDLLLHHLSENDPNRYGTPPAMKDAVEALPDVKVDDTLQCSVCLEEFENGDQAKQMPCNHKFHGGCILPWLELHSSCPVCRYQLPADESKINAEWSRNNSSISSNTDGDGSRREERREESDREGRNENGRRFSFPWPFSSLFNSSGSQSSDPSTDVPPSSSHSNSHAHDD